jgi:putative endonuclease
MARGDYYETKAREFLKSKGYRIIRNNFRSRFGEIDIIAKDKKTVSFIEVKARDSNYLVSGIEAVDQGKREKIKKTALFYVSNLRQQDGSFRFDVLEIIQGSRWRQFNLIKNAFRMDG